MHTFYYFKTNVYCFFFQPVAKDGNTDKPKVTVDSSAAAAAAGVVNSKIDWPQVPQVPDMSNMHCAQFNNIGQKTSIDDLGYKMDQIMGK